MISAEQLRKAESNGHSLFGASGWKRKLLCPGSLAAEIGLPDTSGIDAAEGTVYHRFAERVLKTAEMPDECDGHVVFERGFEIEITSANLEFMMQYVEWCRSLPGVHFVEQFVDLSEWTPIPNQGGTADHAACEIGLLTISDLKFGTGVKIYAEENEQAIGYALGFILEWTWLFEFEKVVIRICQPRLGHFDVWETTVAHLEKRGAEIREGLARAWRPGAPRTPSIVGCKFCRAQVGCPAIVAAAEQVADGTFEDETITIDEAGAVVAIEQLSDAGVWIPPAVARLTTTQLAHFVSHRKLIEDTLKKSYDELVRRARQGDMPEGYMWAEGRMQRFVKSRAQVIEIAEQNDILAAELWESEFLSPAKLVTLFVEKTKKRKSQVEKLLAPYFDSVQGEPVLSLIGPGKRRAVDLADASFEDETRESDDL